MKGVSIHIICVGKLKEKFYIDGAAEYVKRLGGYCKLQLTELPEERLPQNPSRAQIDAALGKEAAAVLIARGRQPFLVPLIRQRESGTEWLSLRTSAKKRTG